MRPTVSIASHGFEAARGFELDSGAQSITHSQSDQGSSATVDHDFASNFNRLPHTISYVGQTSASVLALIQARTSLIESSLNQLRHIPQTCTTSPHRLNIPNCRSPKFVKTVSPEQFKQSPEPPRRHALLRVHEFWESVWIKLNLGPDVAKTALGGINDPAMVAVVFSRSRRVGMWVPSATVHKDDAVFLMLVRHRSGFSND
jgi:hypothetical protein